MRAIRWPIDIAAIGDLIKVLLQGGDARKILFIGWSRLLWVV
jgi:hypothetical protein